MQADEFQLTPVQRVWRYTRITARITALNIRARMQYRGEFFLEVCNGIAWQASVIIFATVLITEFPGLGGWSPGAVLLISSMRMFCHSLFVLFYFNVMRVPLLVQDGRIDGFLVRPFPVYSQVLLSSCSINAFGDMTVAIGLFVAATRRIPVDWSPGTVLFAAFAVVGGVLLEAGIQTVLACLSLRFPGSDSVSMWTGDLMATFGSYPLNILPNALRMVFTFALPVAFVAYVPAAVLVGKVPATGVGETLASLSPAVGVVTFFAAKWLWGRSLRIYRSPGG
jgi:ABC-2 type transport system permease protein